MGFDSFETILAWKQKLVCKYKVSLFHFRLNSKITCTPYHLALNSSNALEIIQKYDIVVDATDNVATRYLLNDACILANKPLVSGSALRFEGQVR